MCPPFPVNDRRSHAVRSQEACMLSSVACPNIYDIFIPQFSWISYSEIPLVSSFHPWFCLGCLLRYTDVPVTDVFYCIFPFLASTYHVHASMLWLSIYWLNSKRLPRKVSREPRFQLVGVLYAACPSLKTCPLKFNL